jgi:hypothetical protein
MISWVKNEDAVLSHKIIWLELIVDKRNTDSGFLYRVGGISRYQKSIAIQSPGYRTNPSFHTFRLVKQINVGIASAQPDIV